MFIIKTLRRLWKFVTEPVEAGSEQKETEAERMWRVWGYDPIPPEKKIGNRRPYHYGIFSEAAEFRRWRKSHRDWLVTRAVNAVVDANPDTPWNSEKE